MRSLWGCRIPRVSPFAAVVVLLCCGISCILATRQRFTDFTIPRPLTEQQTLILGFLGGREPWDNPRDGVRQLALKLSGSGLPVAVETVENQKRKLARQLIVTAFDRNGNRILDSGEKRSVKLILFGQSFGGAAVVKLARELQAEQVPVLLTVQIDSVGLGDSIIPSNVDRAANLYQRNGVLIRGEPRIIAEDPTRTAILGNFRFDYRDRKIDLSGVPFWKKIFRKAHVKMARDPNVWAKVELLILETLTQPPAGEVCSPPVSLETPRKVHQTGEHGS